jgi:nuclear pore complex protein Nup155
LLLDYIFQTIDQQHPDRTRGNREWPVDVLIDVDVPFESVLSVLENNFYNNELQWGVNRRRIAGALIVHVSERWLQESASGGGAAFGNVENTAAVLEALRAVQEAGLLAGRDADALRTMLERVQRLL